MNSRFNEVLEEIEDHFSKYRISDALLSLYTFIWDDFCSWYLEIIKDNSISVKTYEGTIAVMDKILKTLHPFMPFITEEIWLQKKDRKKLIIHQTWPDLDKRSKYAINIPNCVPQSPT